MLLENHNFQATSSNAYKYKYNGKELQETGMIDYGWRHYMPDIGRWNGIDQLAEMYLSTSTYAYVANNPVLRFDVDGRWFNDDGTIDTSGRTPGFISGKQYRDSFLGVNRNDGSGGASGGESLTIGNLTGSAFGFLQSFFLNGGTVDGIVTMVEQLEKAGWEQEDIFDEKLNYEDLYCLIEKVPSLAQLYSTIEGVRFHNDPTLGVPGKAAFYDISLNINRMKNILDFAFTLGHEMTHSFTDIHFRSKFFEVLPQNGRFMRDNTYTYFSEVIGVSWELQYGQNRYGNLSSTDAVRKYYRHIDSKAMDMVDPHVKTLMSAWLKMYNSKIKK